MPWQQRSAHSPFILASRQFRRKPLGPFISLRHPAPVLVGSLPRRRMGVLGTRRPGLGLSSPNRCLGRFCKCHADRVASVQVWRSFGVVECRQHRHVVASRRQVARSVAPGILLSRSGPVL